MPSYDPAADRRWLLQRPWTLISRLAVVLWQLLSLALVLLLQSNSRFCSRLVAQKQHRLKT